MKIAFLVLFAVIFAFIIMGDAKSIEAKDDLTVEEFLRIKRSPSSAFLRPRCKKGEKIDIRGLCRNVVVNFS